MNSPSFNSGRALGAVVARLVYTEIRFDGLIFSTSGLIWTNLSKIRAIPHFRVDPSGLYYPSILFTG
jgi:hypothetical protein